MVVTREVRELALEEEGLDVDGDVAGGPILGADDFAFDAALTVDEIGFGEAGSAVIGSDGFGIVAERGEDHAIIFEEGLVGLGVVVDGDAENDAAFGSNFGLELIERGGFVDAGRAPSGPEIEDDDFAAQIGEVRGLAVEDERKIFGGLAVEAVFSLAVVGREEAVDKDGDGGEDEAGKDAAAQQGVICGALDGRVLGDGGGMCDGFAHFCAGAAGNGTPLMSSITPL